MNDQDIRYIRDKLGDILVAQGTLGEAVRGARKHLGSIDKHLEKQNDGISKNKDKLTTHSVWIKIVSVVVVAVLTTIVVGFFK